MVDQQEAWCEVGQAEVNVVDGEQEIYDLLTVGVYGTGAITIASEGGDIEMLITPTAANRLIELLRKAIELG